jgi:predicted XRE-type DNA-binding protein
MDKEKITRSSGNIFADLDLPNPKELDLKAQVAFLISQMINRQNLSQSAAALKLGIAQPDVSRILRGRLDGYSLERLLTFVQGLGSDVELSFKPAKKNAKGRILTKMSA